MCLRLYIKLFIPKIQITYGKLWIQTARELVKKLHTPLSTGEASLSYSRGHFLVCNDFPLSFTAV